MVSDDLSFVLIVTYGRSGSTVTQNLLNAIPGWCIRGENANAAYGLCRSIATLQAEHNLELRKRNAALPDAERGPRMRQIMGRPIDPWFGAEGIDLGGYVASLRRAFVANILHPPEGTRVAGFKEIRMQNDRGFAETYLDALRLLLPGVKFVFQKRNHDEVLKSGWWPKKDPVQSRSGFEFADALYDRYTAAHPDTAYILTYDDLRAGRVSGLLDFLGVEMSENDIEHTLGQRLDHMKG